MNRGIKLRKVLPLVLVLLIVVALGAYMHGHSNKNTAPNKPEYPEYLSFGGNYVFSVPKGYSVDEQSVLGAVLVYTGSLTAKTVEDVFSQNGIAVQTLSDLSDHSSKAFKAYVNKTFLPNIKKSLASNDAHVKFGKENGYDIARLTLNKDGSPLRFIYFKNGQHPAAVVAKSENDNAKKIEQTIADVEKSDLKNESAAIRQAIQSSLELAKTQKATELYASSAPELRSKTTEAQMTATLKADSNFLNQNINISGGSYNGNEFSVALRFTKIGQSDQAPTFGALTIKKADGQWKLESLSLPKPSP